VQLDTENTQTGKQTDTTHTPISSPGTSGTGGNNNGGGPIGVRRHRLLAAGLRRARR
jgi:hypothetical protein